MKLENANFRSYISLLSDYFLHFQSLKSGAFDHIAAIYHLLMERYRNRNFAASVQLLEEEREKWRAGRRSQSTEELTQRMEQMPGPTDRTSQNKNAVSDILLPYFIKANSPYKIYVVTVVFFLNQFHMPA